MTWTNFFLMLKGAALTLEISLLAIFIGLLGGIFMGIFNCNRIKVFLVSRLCAGYIGVIRGTPLFVQILIVYFGLPSMIGIDLSPFSAGVIALGANSCAYIAETIRSGINALPKGQWEAAHVLGYTRPQTLRFIILPQAIRNILPSLTNEFISLIKESSVLMILGVPELTKVSKDIVARELKPMEIYLIAAAMYFVMTSVLSWVSKKLEGAHDAH